MANESTIGTKEVSKMFSVTPVVLRRFLRSQTKYKDGSYTRYEWKQGDPALKSIGSDLKKYLAQEKAKRKA